MFWFPCGSCCRILPRIGAARVYILCNKARFYERHSMREGPDGALTKQVPVMSIQVTSSNRGSRQRLVQPLCIAIGILVVVAGITGLLFPAISTNQGTNEPQELRPISDTEASFGLINPHNGDNGTDPARTTTIECTQDLTLPVLAGVDVVSYFDDLHEGDPPIFGAESLMSVYNGYRFYFSTWENLLKFEVSDHCQQTSCLDKAMYECILREILVRIPCCPLHPRPPVVRFQKRLKGPWTLFVTPLLRHHQL